MKIFFWKSFKWNKFDLTSFIGIEEFEKFAQNSLLCNFRKYFSFESIEMKGMKNSEWLAEWFSNILSAFIKYDSCWICHPLVYFVMENIYSEYTLQYRITEYKYQAKIFKIRYFTKILTQLFVFNYKLWQKIFWKRLRFFWKTKIIVFNFIFCCNEYLNFCIWAGVEYEKFYSNIQIL